MTTAEKLAMLKSLLKITGTAQDTELGVYLTLSQKEIINWRYGGTSKPNICKAVNSKGNDVGISAPMFIAKLTPTTGTAYVFTYSETAESWQYASADVALEDYGITAYILPVDSETITVTYRDGYLVEYDMVQIMACVAGYGLSGAENQTSHNENGIQRSFKHSDMIDYIHAHVLRYVGVI
jgi:hypothetical protein